MKLALCAVMALATAAFAQETVKLKNGTIVEGKVIKVIPTTVEIEGPHGKVVMKWTELDKDWRISHFPDLVETRVLVYERDEAKRLRGEIDEDQKAIEDGKKALAEELENERDLKKVIGEARVAVAMATGAVEKKALEDERDRTNAKLIKSMRENIEILRALPASTPALTALKEKEVAKAEEELKKAIHDSSQ